jgi:hypothetical protein
MVDPRRVVGNPVWAKALHVSRDCRQIYDADLDKLWIEGIVLEYMVSKPDGACRATTLIKVKYTIGNGERVKIINISQLKKDNPNPRTEQEEPTARSSSATSSPENLEQSSSAGSQQVPPQSPTVTTAQAVPETVRTQGSSSTSSSQRPVATVHEMDWFDDDTTSYPTNGSFPCHTWKLFCQYTDQEFTPGCNPEGKVSAMEFFMAVFPKEQLRKMVDETSDALRLNAHPKLTKGELLKWFGILLDASIFLPTLGNALA